MTHRSRTPEMRSILSLVARDSFLTESGVIQLSRVRSFLLPPGRLIALRPSLPTWSCGLVSMGQKEEKGMPNKGATADRQPGWAVGPLLEIVSDCCSRTGVFGGGR